jgi:hypothetical protein
MIDLEIKMIRNTKLATDKIAILKAEIAAIKRERKDHALALKKERTWVNAKKYLPENETRRVIAWANEQLERCWFHKGNFYVYDGTFFLTDKEILNDVTHWMPTDWMYSSFVPRCGPGLKNYLRYHWLLFTNRASNMAHDLRPRGWSNNAQLDKKVVYFTNAAGEIRMGLPENFPATKGFNKVVCNNVHEAEVWSDRLRQYNISKEAQIDARREQVEGEMAKQHRSEIHNLMANSHSKYGKLFLQTHLDRMDKAESRRRMTREEYNHNEGYERGR